MALNLGGPITGYFRRSKDRIEPRKTHSIVIDLKGVSKTISL
jgi:hypothetical protein